MNGIPMVATSPVRHHDSPVMNPVEIHSYEPPWKALTDFALHTDLDRLNNGPPPVGGQFQHLVNQVCKKPDLTDYSLWPPQPSCSRHLAPLIIKLVVVRRVNRRRLLLWPAAADAADQQSLLQPHLRLMFLNKHYDSIIFTFADARLSRHAAR